MANSKIKTLWTLSGRVVDSREVLDTNGGLRAGRVDIPESLMVKFEGYTKIEYRVILSDGSVSKYPTFEALMAAFNATIETKNGSGFMTIFIPFNAVLPLGIFQIDVYKEWEDGEDPEPEPAVEYVAKIVKATMATRFGFAHYNHTGFRGTVYFGGDEVNRTLPDSVIIQDLTKRIVALEAKVTTPSKD